MTPRLARCLVRLYPRGWRERYGEEFEVLLQDGPGGIRALINVLFSAMRERLAEPITVEVIINQSTNSIVIQRQWKTELAMALPGLPILIYLAVHTSEGWQLMVVGFLLSGFVAAWHRRSRILLTASYLVTCSLFAWVVWVNR